jgi:hypothetical protein
MLGVLSAVALIYAQETIDVVGRRLENKCESQQCSTAEDSAESIRVAQALFLVGDYRGAGRIIRRAIGRQDKAAKTEPMAVSALYRADSNIAAHWGDNERFRRSTYRGAAILREAFGPTDTRSIVAASFVGMMELQLGRRLQAERTFENAAHQARNAGIDLLADALEVHSAWLQSVANPNVALTSLAAYAENETTDPRVKVQAAVLASRIARGQRKASLEQRMLAIIAANNRSEAPVLLGSPIGAEEASRQRITFDRAPGLELSNIPSITLEWIDVGFWVRPDGGVEDVTILNDVRKAPWSSQVVRSVAARRYAPIDAEPGDPGWYRVERFTMRSAFADLTRSRIKARGGLLELRQMDITKEITRARPGADTGSEAAPSTPAR